MYTVYVYTFYIIYIDMYTYIYILHSMYIYLHKYIYIEMVINDLLAIVDLPASQVRGNSEPNAEGAVFNGRLEPRKSGKGWLSFAGVGKCPVLGILNIT